MKQVSVEEFEEVAYVEDVNCRTTYEPEGYTQHFYRDGVLVAVCENYDFISYMVKDDA